MRIDLPEPREGEKDITTFIEEGKWTLVICNSSEESRDFQWYAIEKLNPLFNRERRS